MNAPNLATDRPVTGRVFDGQDMNRRLNQIRHVALDMDGTIYKGGTLFAVTDPFLGLMRELGIG